jgi:hypothetical protein
MSDTCSPDSPHASAEPAADLTAQITSSLLRASIGFAASAALLVACMVGLAAL